MKYITVVAAVIEFPKNVFDSCSYKGNNVMVIPESFLDKLIRICQFDLNYNLL